LNSLWSFEEVLTLIGAGLISVLAYFFGRKFFGNPQLVVLVVFFLTAICLSYVTSSTFILQPTGIEYRTLFVQQGFRYNDVSNVNVRRIWALLPGQSIFFLMRPSSKVAGYSIRIGIFSWPDSRRWADSVNAVLADKAAKVNLPSPGAASN